MKVRPKEFIEKDIRTIPEMFINNVYIFLELHSKIMSGNSAFAVYQHGVGDAGISYMFLT